MEKKEEKYSKSIGTKIASKIKQLIKVFKVKSQGM